MRYPGYLFNFTPGIVRISNQVMTIDSVYLPATPAQSTPSPPTSNKASLYSTHTHIESLTNIFLFKTIFVT